MSSIKGYEQWIFENENKEKASEFISKVKERLEKEKFVYEDASLPIQKKRGNFVMKNISNPTLVKQKMEQWGIFEKDRLPGFTRKDIEKLYELTISAGPSSDIIIYGSGNIRFDKGSSNGVKFDNTTEEGLETCIEWITKQLLEHVCRNLLGILECKDYRITHKSFTGYDIPKKSMELIEATLKGSMKDSGSKPLSDAISSFSENFRRSIGPFLVAAYLLSKRTDNVFVSVNNAAVSTFKMGIEAEGNSRQPWLNKAIRLFSFKEFKLSKDLKTVSFYENIKFKSVFNSEFKTYKKIIEHNGYPEEMIEALKEAYDPEIIKKIEELAITKRGFIASKKFGF